VIHGMLKCTWQNLPLQVNSEKSRTGINVFVARHLFSQNITLHFDLDICFGSRHDALMKILFLQLR
jgi:hypothetical protein